MIGTRAIACLLAATVVAAAAPRDDAQRRFEIGLRHYAVAAYDAAIAEFKAAYELEPRPSFLYNLAQAERLSGDCERAIVTYRTFLRTRPARAWAEAAQGNIDRCAALGAAPAPRVAEPAPRVEPAPAPAPPVVAADAAAPVKVDRPARVRTRTPWYKDPLGDVLAAGGILALGAGAALWATADVDIRAANRAATLDEFTARGAGAEGRRIGGIVTVSVGGALLLGGIIRYVARPAARERAPRLARTP